MIQNLIIHFVSNDMSLNFISIFLLGSWAKHVYTNTLSQYKAMCCKWYSGTGGGDGRSTFFESWDLSKLNKYSIDPSQYDHTNVSSRPSILIDSYHSNRTPYLTMIFLWDEMVDFLLSSRYDPLDAGTGEAGMLRPNDDDNSSIINISPISNSSTRPQSKSSKMKSKRSRKSNDSFDLKDTMKEMIDLISCSNKSDESSRPSQVEPTRQNVNSETLALSDLLKLLETHKSHYNFLKENNLLTEERKKTVLQDIDAAHSSISELQHNKRRRLDNDDNNSNSISTVS